MIVRLPTIWTVFLLACCGAASATPASAPATQPRPASREAPSTRPTEAAIAALWYEPSGMSIRRPGEEFEPRRLIVGVWGDGRVVWSDNRATGGAPYRAARIDADVVARLKESLRSAGLFELDRQIQFGPDASITVIGADVGGQRQWLGTWHEPPSSNPLRVIDQRGIYAIKPGERRPEPSPEYAKFLKVWAESRRLIESVVPKTGEAVSDLDETVFKLGRDNRS